MELKHIFGPVPSRRLGISAGIDLIPYKTCSLNCIYCECGKTTNLTTKRKEYVSISAVIEELKKFLKPGPDLDYITFSGSGEPTLHLNPGKIIDFIKNNYPQYKVALLTNGTLFYNNNDLINDIKKLDLIVPSLDAVSKKTFEKINRPVSSLRPENIISGLIQLRNNYSGKIWLEIFIIAGINDTDSELKLIKKAINQIKPDKIQLNTLDRPGTEEWVKPVSRKKLKSISDYLGENTEIIAKFESKKTNIKDFRKELKTNILKTLKRRPCTSEDLAHILGVNVNEINKLIKYLIENNKIQIKTEKRGKFYYLN